MLNPQTKPKGDECDMPVVEIMVSVTAEPGDEKLRGDGVSAELHATPESDRVKSTMRRYVRIVIGDYRVL